MEKNEHPITVNVQLPKEEKGISFSDALRIISRKWIVLAATTAIFLLAGIGISFYLSNNSTIEYSSGLLTLQRNEINKNYIVFRQEELITYVQNAQVNSSWQSVGAAQILEWTTVLSDGLNDNDIRISINPAIPVDKESLQNYTAALGEAIDSNIKQVLFKEIDKDYGYIEESIRKMCLHEKDDYPIALSQMKANIATINAVLRKWSDERGLTSWVAHMDTLEDMESEVLSKKITRNRNALLDLLSNEIAELELNIKISEGEVSEMERYLAAHNVGTSKVEEASRQAYSSAQLLIEQKQKLAYYQHLQLIYQDAVISNANVQVDLAAWIEEADVVASGLLKEKEAGSHILLPVEISSRQASNFGRTKMVLVIGGMAFFGLVLALLIIFFKPVMKAGKDIA